MLSAQAIVDACSTQERYELLVILCEWASGEAARAKSLIEHGLTDGERVLARQSRIHAIKAVRSRLGVSLKDGLAMVNKELGL